MKPLLLLQDALKLMEAPVGAVVTFSVKHAVSVAAPIVTMWLEDTVALFASNTVSVTV